MQILRVVYLVVFVLISSSIAQNYGGLYLGMNHYLSSNETNSFNIDNTGLAAGFIIHVNFPGLAVFYKVKATSHQRHYESIIMEGIPCEYYCSPIEYFFSASNEFLIGPIIKVNEKIELFPQIGIGAIGEAAYRNWDSGFTHGDMFFDLSLLVKYKLAHFDTGIMINYEHDLIEEARSLISDNRLNLVLMILK